MLDDVCINDVLLDAAACLARSNTAKYHRAIAMAYVKTRFIGPTRMVRFARKDC